MDKLFKMHPNSFTSQGKNLLKTLANNENKIDYKHLSYKILIHDSTFHMINFLENYGILFSFLESLTTGKVTVSNANADQISFIIKLNAWI